MITFERTLVFSDFHGDLDIMAKSFAAKDLMTYGIKRIICGHTPFLYFSDYPGPRMKKIKTMEEEIGLEYICIDNGCSRAYRRDKPVLNGIEIDAAGNILEEKTTMENDNR